MPNRMEDFPPDADLEFSVAPSPRVEELRSQFREKLDSDLHGREYFDPETRDLIDPSLQRGAIENSLHGVKMLTDDLDCRSLEERKELAYYVALDALSAMPGRREPGLDDPAAGQFQQSEELIHSLLEDRLSAYDTGGRHQIEQQLGFSVNALNNLACPEFAEAAAGYFAALLKREENRDKSSLETSPEFTPERYRHEGLTEFQQAAAEQAVHAFQAQFPPPATARWKPGTWTRKKPTSAATAAPRKGSGGT